VNRYQKQKEKNARRLEKLNQRKEIFDQRREIHETKKSMRRIWIPETTSSKKYVRFILGNCTAVEAYSMVAMWVKDDLSALYALIGAVVTEGVAFAVYAAKAYKETEREEANKLERDKQAELISFEKYKLENGYTETEEDTEPDREAAMG